MAKGGNLLLNVGPRGEDARIPDLQLLRLEWLSELTRDAGASLFGTRPWVIAEGETEPGVEIRYTASPEAVHALVRGPAEHPRSLRFAAVRAGAATARGARLACRSGPGGTVVELEEALSPVAPRAITFPGAECVTPR